MFVIFLCFVIGFIYGIHAGDIDYIVICGLPLLGGFIAFILQAKSDKLLEELAEKDPEAKKILKERERRRAKRF